MNEILKEALDKLRGIKIIHDPAPGFVDLLGALTNPSQSIEIKEIKSSLEIICRTLITAIEIHEMEIQIAKQSALDAKTAIRTMIESSLTAVCPGCDQKVPVVNMKAKCTKCETEGHLVWNWKGSDGREII